MILFINRSAAPDTGLRKRANSLVGLQWLWRLTKGLARPKEKPPVIKSEGLSAHLQRDIGLAATHAKPVMPSVNGIYFG